MLALAAFVAISTGLADAGQIPLALRLALANFDSARSYHMSFASPDTKIEIDIVKPDRLRSSINGNVETISIGNTMYIHGPTGWLKTAGADAADANFQDLTKELSIAKMSDPSVTIVDKGMTTFAGRPCHRYAVAKSGEPPSTVDVGIDNEIYRIAGGGADADKGAIFSKFNAPIRISAPI